MIEKERKWLLKNFDPLLFKIENILIIEQVYHKGFRYRSTTDLNTTEQEFIRIKKIKLADGVNFETNLKIITEKEFNQRLSQSSFIIKKTRFLIKHNDLILEVDVFFNKKLIILEIENVDINQKISFPKELKELIVMEVTKFNEFSNFNLSK